MSDDNAITAVEWFLANGGDEEAHMDDLAYDAELRALTKRLEALAAEADAGGDHPTAARIRAALYDDDTDDGEGEGE